ncbi:MAG: hypothetical protein MK291_10025 [Planctomycetes bacterium]|nr:hypothetical protein [Planctomycetota bacterium]
MSPSSNDRLADRSFFPGALALSLLTVGITSLMTGCVSSSESEAFNREDYGRMATEMREAVASGWLTEEEMTSKLGELRMQIAPRANDDRRASRGAIKTRLGAIEEKVESGEMSREDADENIAKVRRRIAAGRGERAEEPRTFTRAEYARAKEKIDGMVKAGEVSQADADTRLGQMRRMIASDQSERGREAKTITRAEYAAAKEKMDEMVKAGEASQEDVDTRLGQMRRMIASDQSERGGETRSRGAEDFDWDEVKERIEAAVEAGEVTREQADARYKAIEERLEAGGETAEKVSARVEYANAEAKIKAMVEAGEVSAEDAELRLKQMREHLFGDR